MAWLEIIVSSLVIWLGFSMNTPANAQLPAGVSLDPESAECIFCHETVGVSDTMMVCHTDVCDHPIGLDYAALSMRNPGYKKPSELDPAIKLPDGKIGCTTCHVPYSEANHLALAEQRRQFPSKPDPMLSVDNTRSALCNACHSK